MEGPVLDTRSAAIKSFIESWKGDVRAASAAMSGTLQRKGLDGPPASVPDVSTLTVIFQTDCKIDIKMLQEASLVTDRVPAEPALGSISLIATASKQAKFTNQVSFRYTPGKVGTTRKNCKVFANGKFHLTGARSAGEAIGTLKVVIRTIRALRPDCTQVERPVKVQSAKIQMINTDFRLNTPINLEALRDTITGKYGVYCRYEPDHFPGCNIKFASATVLAFKSESVIVTGAKRMEDIAQAFAFVIGAVTESPTVLNSQGRTPAWEEDNAKKERSRVGKRSFLELIEDKMDERATELPTFQRRHAAKRYRPPPMTGGGPPRLMEYSRRQPHFLEPPSRYGPDFQPMYDTTTIPVASCGQWQEPMHSIYGRELRPSEGGVGESAIYSNPYITAATAGRELTCKNNNSFFF
ncbi:TATA-box binding protein [Klebsormidium nitens]|uniref:TATA-box binding protein n=1 Tax=Klebsormidium nitens TaxID=105231 RepID=A0A1Y1ICM3_KLENI|nr:TATA-box binding protein [Klebsormidium nitens]|eukprot:GAQ88704.1 TATA-box binding protein [Klebsormidium nitens]